MAAKYLILKSISRSQRIIAKERVGGVAGTVSIPNMEEIYNKSLPELKKLKITEVHSNQISTLGFKLSDG